MGLELGKDKTQWTPAHVKFFEGSLSVQDVKCGDLHTLVYGSVVKKQDSTAIYSMGWLDQKWCLGLQDDQIRGANKDKIVPW